MILVGMLVPSGGAAADKLVSLYSAHAVPYAMPWVAEEMGMFKKYDLDFEFVYIPSSSTATAALLGGNVDVGLLGGIGVVNAFINGATDLVLIDSIKNFMTQSILAKPEVTKLQELKGKKIGVTRIGSNTHYFSVQAFRRAGMNPEKMEPRLDLKLQVLQVMIDEVAKVNPRAQETKPQDLVDRRYLTEMENSGFFTQVWAEKR
jgi:ABC-type nitrate/sulfonate/bicarbonate transport system substrate-binding protein